MTRFAASLALLLLTAGCATHQAVTQQSAQPDLAIFSANPAGGLPDGWEPLILHRNKNHTRYQLVSDEDMTVLHARAENASSGLMYKVEIQPHEQPWLQWRWKINSLVKSANNSKRATEDSPVRIILGFDGDKDTMPFADQVLFETARVMTGYDFPFATLMYIWENNAPVGTVIPSTYTSRIKMMVAESGPGGVGEWREFARNIIEDYEKAFGEKPGKLIGVGVLTDTDNTGESTEAWYGDIRLMRERFARQGRPPREPLVLSVSQRK